MLFPSHPRLPPSAAAACGFVILALVLLATMLMPSPGNAQTRSERAYLGPHPSPLFNTGPGQADTWALPEALEPAQFTAAVNAKSRSSYWLEGAIAGGVLFAAAGMFLANGLCDADSGTDNCTSAVLLTGLSTATAGGVIGAFVGKTIPKGGKAAAQP